MGYLRIVGEGRWAIIQPEILGWGNSCWCSAEVRHIIGAKSENGLDLYFCITCKSDHWV